MRVERTVSYVPWTSVIEGRNCDPANDCKWNSIKEEGQVRSERSFVRSEIQRNPAVNGWRAPSNYTATLLETGVLKGNFQVTNLFGFGENANGGSRFRRDGAFYEFSVDNSFVPPSERDSARLKARALSKLKNQQIDISMALATRRQTMDLMASNAARLAKAYSQARQRNFAGAARTLGFRNSVRPGTKSASSGWLQLQFGWMPLASDIYGAYQELTMSKPTNGDLIVIRVSDDSSEASDTTYPYYPLARDRGGVELEIKNTSSRTIKQSYWWRLDLESLHAASRNGLTDPLVVAWDLVPFSFMVDWLLPVGQYLRNCSADLGFAYLGGSQTYFERRFTNVKSGKILPVTYQVTRDNSVTGKMAGSSQGIKMIRTVLPKPSAEMYIKNPLSTFTVVTSLALLTQRFQSSTPWRTLAKTTVRGG